MYIRDVFPHIFEGADADKSRRTYELFISSIILHTFRYKALFIVLYINFEQLRSYAIVVVYVLKA